MKNYLILFLLFIFFQGRSQVVFQSPINITSGGTYTGNYLSNDSNIPAITVSTSDAVLITNCIIESAGDCIKCNGGSRLTVTNNTIKAINPTGENQWGRAVNNYMPASFIFTNNTVQHTGGILIDHGQGTDTSFQIIISRNIIINTDRRLLDKTIGSARAAIQFNTVWGLYNSEISWNQITNRPDSSCVEDCINFYNSSGLQSSPLLVHDNFIHGAYPYPANLTSFSGSGITADGSAEEGNTYATMTAFINAYKNQVLQTCNAGMNIAAGHDVHFYNNEIITTGLLPDQTKIYSTWAGCCIWNGSNLSLTLFTNNSISNNTIGYVHWGGGFPYADRQDEMSDRIINLMPAGSNTYLENAPITLNMIQNEKDAWQLKLKENQVNIGVLTTK